MSVKAALFYNTLSSLLCTAGMILGVLLGSLPAVNAWMFLLTAGMFVYIALVDMVSLATAETPNTFYRQNISMII